MASSASQAGGMSDLPAKRPRLMPGVGDDSSTPYPAPTPTGAKPQLPEMPREQAEALLDSLDAAFTSMCERVLVRTGVDLPHAYANTQRDATAGAGVMASTYLAIPGMPLPLGYGPVVLPKKGAVGDAASAPMGSSFAPLSERGSSVGGGGLPTPSAVATGGTNRWLECWKCLGLVSGGQFVLDTYQAVSAKAWEAAAVGTPFPPPLPRQPGPGEPRSGRFGRAPSDVYDSTWPPSGTRDAAPSCQKGWDWWGVRRDEPAVRAVLDRQAAEARRKEAEAAAAAAVEQHQRLQQEQQQQMMLMMMHQQQGGGGVGGLMMSQPPLPPHLQMQMMHHHPHPHFQQQQGLPFMPPRGPLNPMQQHGGFHPGQQQPPHMGGPGGAGGAFFVPSGGPLPQHGGGFVPPPAAGPHMPRPAGRGPGSAPRGGRR